MNKSGFVNIIIIGIIVITITAAGYFALTQKTAEAPAINQEVETADWKTYRNEKYSFEIKYPPDWYYIDQEFNPLSGLFFKLAITNSKQIKLNPVLLDTPNRKSPENELIYSLTIWKNGNIAKNYQEDVHYKVLGVMDGNAFVGVDSYKNPNKQIFDQILSTFKFIE